MTHVAEADDAPGSGKGWVEPASEVASNIVTAVAGMLGGPEASSVAVGASPMVKHVFGSIGSRWHDLSRRGGERVLEEAAAAGVPVEELEARIGEDDERLLLAGAAINAGTRTAYPDKVRALGRALAAGVSDDALVDPERLAVAALNDMEAPHVKVLGHMAEGSWVGPHAEPRWAVSDLARALPEVALVLAPVLATLERHALVERDQRVGEAVRGLEKERRREDERVARTGAKRSACPPKYKALPPRWFVTEFGLHVLDLLRKVPQDPSPEADRS